MCSLGPLSLSFNSLGQRKGNIVIVICNNFFMAKTKNFILRLDEEMMNAIEAWAADEFRSTNGQLQWIISEALKKSGRMKKKKKKETQENTDNEK